MQDIITAAITESPKLKCPTCGLRFHHLLQCRRCGTDLSLLMKTASAALFLRNEARRLMKEGRFDLALKQARKAQSLQKTGAGKGLAQLAENALRKGSAL